MPDLRKEPSLDEIVAQSAVVVADQIQKAAGWAKSEMDLQVEVAGALKEFARRAQITLEGHHNVTIATGRPDSVYGSVIVEYKDPNTLSANRDASSNKALIDQLKRRFYDIRREENRPWNSMFGVGTDGNYFIFLRFRDDKWTDQEPLEVNRYSTERFLWALYNLGQRGKPYQPEYLHGDFGSESRIAQEGIGTLYDEILETDNPRAQVFFNQWKILFGEVCGYDVENLSDKLKKLAEFYGVKGRPHPAQLLFALHTYFALLIKLLAAEIVSFFNPWMPRQVEKLQNATTSSKLRRELEQLERGGIFHDMGITNFLEGDLFSWYLAVWSEPIELLARRMIGKLDEYNPGTFSEDPAQSRDLLKKLYQQLFPKSVRHDLGEYYTPDWLAEHVLNELGYEGDPDKRLLDPACGSGTFLVMAINGIRRWYDANREKCPYDEGGLLKKILANIVGFDLNPLAVMAARTNYLVAIKDLIRHVDQIEIPIYLCDSIMTPAEYGDLFTGSGKVAKVPCSALKPPHLLVPKEIAKNPKEVARYADVLETSIRNGSRPEEFLSRCREEGLIINATDAHTSLYKELVRLDKENKNGIWARIIKNNFAPLFVGLFTYVAGNPPWVNWQSLPEEYRDEMKPLWKKYGLFSLSGSAGRLGGGKKDLSMLFVYASVDHFLHLSGKLGFLITQSVFKTKGAGDGFRKLNFERDSKRIFIKPLVVHDLSAIQVFEGATNRTALLICERREKGFEYPVRYVSWRGPSRLEQDETLAQVTNQTSREELRAVPVERRKSSSPWLTTTEKLLPVLRKVIGTSPYKAHAGCCTWLNSVYWVRILNKLPSGQLAIENLWDVGEIKVQPHQAVVEPDLVYPLFRGRDIHRWKATPSAHVLLTQDPQTRTGIPESTMKKLYPKTYKYLLHFEKELRKRSGYRQYYDEADPFYSVYNVGPYTVAPWKVLWKHTGVQDSMRACVVEKSAIPDQKVILVDFQSEDEAHYFCGCINSASAFSVIKNYIGLDASPHVLDAVAIPQFEKSSLIHRQISDRSQQCHEAALRNGDKDVSRLEEEIDHLTAELWQIEKNELKAIHDELAN